MNVGDPVAVIWTGFMGDGVALVKTVAHAVHAKGFVVRLSEGHVGAAVFETPYPFSIEGTHWCHDTPEAVAALQSAYALT